MNKPCIFFRVDGNSTIGLGHVSRCTALAELLRENFEITFAICEPDSHILFALTKVATRVISLPVPKDTEQFNGELHSHLAGNEIIVLDGYHFTTAYEISVKKKSAAVIAIDDIPSRHFVADGIINFCGAVKPSDYSREFYTQLYLGLNYLFLRSPFLRSHPEKKSTDNKLLLNMGGADPTNETHRILKQLLDFKYSGEIVVVVGQSYRHVESLKILIGTHPSIKLEQGLSAEAMFDVMRHCPMAVLPPSTVALEYLSTGGLLFVNLLAENQRCMRSYLIEEGLAYDYTRLTEGVMSMQSDNSMVAKIFDGSSLNRVRDLFMSLSLSSKIKLRKAIVTDATTVYDWANDPDVRQSSYSKAAISWDGHIQWFISKIADPRCEYFIAEIDTVPVAQIRFDLSAEEDEAYVISYLIAKDWRGKGLGNPVLIKGIQKLGDAQNARKIVGYVKNSNNASIKAFDRAGFKKIETLKYPDSSKFVLSF